MPTVRNFTVFADYFQFVVQDENSDDDFATIWTEEALSTQKGYPISSTEAKTLDSHPVILSALCLLG